MGTRTRSIGLQTTKTSGLSLSRGRSFATYSRVSRPVPFFPPSSPPSLDRICDELVVASPEPSHFELVHVLLINTQRLSRPTPARTMAPYHFDSPNADVILRSSDGKEFRVHQLILSLASPFFRATFHSPQPKSPRSKLRRIDVPHSSDILQPFLQYLYPQSPPKISDVSMWAALYTVADKYGAEAVTGPLRDMLVPRFLKKSPLRVYALASRWGFEEEARIASRRTLKTVDVLATFPQEDAELMGAAARQRLHRLHSNRREQARALVNSHLRPTPSNSSCTCPPPAYANFRPALCQSMATRPWLTLEDVHKVESRFDYPKTCKAGSHCRHSNRNRHAYFCLLLRKISELPHTV